MANTTHQSPLLDGQIPALFYDRTELLCRLVPPQIPTEPQATDEVPCFLAPVDTLITWLQFSILEGNNNCVLEQELDTSACYLLLKKD